MSSENLPEFLNLRQRLQKRADGTGIDTGNIDLEAEFFLAETQSQDVRLTFSFFFTFKIYFLLDE